MSSIMPRALRRSSVLGAFLALLLGFPAAVEADDLKLEQWPEGGHIRVTDPADLSTEEAEKIYQALQPALIEGYERAGIHGLDYRDWIRLNANAYLSDQHGARLVNVFTNDEGANALNATRDDPVPIGAKIIKDSISVVASGGVARGPLFLMEKMPAGFDPPNGDWRYTMIMPNGRLFGTTGGQGNAAIKFCAECHALAEETDFVFEIPAEHLAAEE